jgi:Protein of unknown function (DUF3039)
MRAGSWPLQREAHPNYCGRALRGGVARNVHLCGHRFLPVRDPQRFPVCPRCKELAGMLGIEGLISRSGKTSRRSETRLST